MAEEETRELEGEPLEQRLQDVLADAALAGQLTWDEMDAAATVLGNHFIRRRRRILESLVAFEEARERQVRRRTA